MPFSEGISTIQHDRVSLEQEKAKEWLLHAEHLMDQRGAHFSSQAEFLRHFPDTDLLLRRMDPKNILAILEGESIFISPKAIESGYANTVWWNPKHPIRGLKTALQEGYGEQHGIVTVVIGTLGNLTVRSIESTPASTAAREDGVRVCAIAGEWDPHQVLGMIFRIPAGRMPDTWFTESEQDELEEENPPLYFFRFLPLVHTRQ